MAEGQSWEIRYAPGPSLLVVAGSSMAVVTCSAPDRVVETLHADVLAATSLADLTARLDAYAGLGVYALVALGSAPDGQPALLVRGQMAARRLDADSGTAGEPVGMSPIADPDTWRSVEVIAGDGVVLASTDPDVRALWPLAGGAVSASTVVVEWLAGTPHAAAPTALSAAATPSGSAHPQGSSDQHHPVGSLGGVDSEDGPGAAAPGDADGETRAVAADATPEDGASAEDTALISAVGPRPWRPDTSLAAAAGLVGAVFCEGGHANRPGTGKCRSCGRPVPPQPPQGVPQPVLAVLRSTDGESVALDRPVLIGRAPREDTAAHALARLLVMRSGAYAISRTHVVVTPIGWDILVTDVHSTNGTTLISPGGERTELTPGEPTSAEPGSVLELAHGVTVSIVDPDR